MGSLSSTDALNALDAQYAHTVPSGYTQLTSTASDPAYAANGVDGVAYVNNDTGQVIVSYAGHNPADNIFGNNPWRKTDLGIMRGDVHVNDNLRKYGDKFMKDVQSKAKPNSDIEQTGLSEGAYINQLVNQDTHVPGIGFGGPGVLGNSNPSHTGNFTNVLGAQDPIAQRGTDTTLHNITDSETGQPISADHVGTIQTVGDGNLNSYSDVNPRGVGSALWDQQRIRELNDKQSKYHTLKEYRRALSARKDNTNIMVTKGPDVLKTPVGGQMVPVPYNSVARLGQGQWLASSVFVNGRQDFHLDSRSEIIEGHQPGTGKGVVVPGYEKFSHAKRASPTVFSEGFGEVRDGDPAWINHPTVGPEEPRRSLEKPSILPLLWAQKHPQGVASP